MSKIYHLKNGEFVKTRISKSLISFCLHLFWLLLVFTYVLHLKYAATLQTLLILRACQGVWLNRWTLHLIQMKRSCLQHDVPECALPLFWVTVRFAVSSLTQLYFPGEKGSVLYTLGWLRLNYVYSIIVPNLVHGWVLCVELCGLFAEVIHNLPALLTLPVLLLLLGTTRGIHIPPIPLPAIKLDGSGLRFLLPFMVFFFFLMPKAELWGGEMKCIYFLHIWSNPSVSSQGAFTFRGSMIDMPSVKQAQNIVALSVVVPQKSHDA